MFAKAYAVFKHLRFTARFYALVFVLILAFTVSYLFPWLYGIAFAGLVLLLLASFSDAWLLFRHREPLTARRSSKYKKLSNGDVNDIELQINSAYAFRIHLRVIDEVPVQFQLRDFLMHLVMEAGAQKNMIYQLRPLARGEYHFGYVNLFVSSGIGLIERHIRGAEPLMLPSYPSFIRLKQFELMAISNRLSDAGIKKVRRIGHSTEFEQIKEYVRGDDVRRINWKATARRGQLMLNHFVDERAQQVYCVIDMGRVMQMPFEGLSLLDYAINSSLVFGHVAWVKQDKPGLIGFAEKPLFMVNADRRGNQLLRLQETLYNAKTNFMESSFENLLSQVRRQVTQRSLFMLYTNFETLSALKRQLKYIKKLASLHLVVVVFFENTELRQLLGQRPNNTFDIYQQTIAQKFDYEKRQIAKELEQHGILWVYTSPQQLTVNTLNKYLEIKGRGLI